VKNTVQLRGTKRTPRNSVQNSAKLRGTKNSERLRAKLRETPWYKKPRDTKKPSKTKTKLTQQTN